MDVRSIAAAEPQRSYRAADRSERIAQFVREHRQKLVLPSVRVRQLLCDTAQVVLQTLSFCDVLAHGRERNRPSIHARQAQYLVRHPPGVAGLEVPKADLDLTVAILQDRWKKLVHDAVLVFGEKERRHRRATSLLDVIEPHHPQSGAIDEER